jgi:multiple sugar transport system substrate-binding protein
MVTIKDIARKAGVSQGTVSHVLNGKGIVSSEKIRLVEQAATELGYIINERAKILRQGKGKILAAILPNINFRQYVDFYISFKAFAEQQGYSVLQFISDDNPELERDILAQIRSGMAAGAAIFSCAKRSRDDLGELGFAEWELLFVERDQAFPCNYAGFDYQAAGKDMASILTKENSMSIALITGNPSFSQEEEFYHAFMKELKKTKPDTANRLEKFFFHGPLSLIDIFHHKKYQAIISTNYGFTQTIQDAWQSFYPSGKIFIGTISPLFTMPKSNFIKYELNYRLLGRISAQQLIENITRKKTKHRIILKNTGFRQWYPESIMVKKNPPILRLLTLESPASNAIGYLARIFTQASGIPIKISVFSYDEIYEILDNMEKSNFYDIIRFDIIWLSWLASRLLHPLEKIDPDINSVLYKYIDGLDRQYFFTGDILYTLPVSPSNQMLFYRKDLFESTALKRLFQETYKVPLNPPENFAEYNRIAQFFTRSENSGSPVDFGTTLLTGSPGVLATEFLSRYYSYTNSLFSDTGSILLAGRHALRALKDLVEIKKYAQKYTCTWWTDAARVFSQGNTAMTILYSNFAADIFGGDSRVINKTGYAIVPGGNPLIGGGALGVSKYSSHPKEALAFIKWICDEPAASALTLLGNVPPCKESFDNGEIIDAYPWLELSRQCFAYSKCQRSPPSSKMFDQHRFLNILGLEIKNALSEAVSPEEALARAHKQYLEAGHVLMEKTKKGGNKN